MIRGQKRDRIARAGGHSIVHWNLPSNPVDLEQREGRIHRYKGHALRKNIAWGVWRKSV